MPQPGSLILVDTNTIIEAHRTRSWAALSQRYRLETVQECFAETQTGAQGRRAQANIDRVTLRASLQAVHVVPDVDILAVDILEGAILDDGEKELWAHAIKRPDEWFLCGPDQASMRFGFDNRMRQRLVSLEEMLAAIGHRTAIPLATQYQKRWLDNLLSDWALGILR